MRIAVVGSRGYTDAEFIHKILNSVRSQIVDMIGDDDNMVIVSGGARGVDTIAENWAKSKGIQTLIFLPDWNQYGRKAGFIRNQDIVKNSDWVIAFWDGVSNGTRSSIELAKKYGIHVDVYVEGKLQSEKDMEWWNGEFKNG